MAARAPRTRSADRRRQLAASGPGHGLARQALDNGWRHEMLGRLSGGLAHDLNNLLGIVSNSALLLRQSATDPEAKAAIAASLRAVERASSLTAQLLRLSDACGESPGPPWVADAARLLAAMHEPMLAVLGRRIALQVRVAADARPIAVDPEELELALLALLLNGREAMPQGGRLWIEVRNAEPAELVEATLACPAAVAITVSDDGIGMGDDLVARAFVPHVTRRQAAGGAGLGLSRVRCFCEAAGGRAALASTPGFGTSVTLLLPAAPEHASPRAPATMPTRRHDTAAIDATLLLVEDNRELADVTAALLATFGLRVLQAHDATQALARLEEAADIDLVLSDIVMPGARDGVEMARQIRQRHPRLPIVLITAFSTALSRAGDFTVLRKPCSAELLIDTLRQQLAGSARCPPEP